MKWKNRELKTIFDLMTHGINECENKVEALEFMSLYRKECPAAADVNIGYLSGYYSPQEAQRIMDWFEVSHPVFGRGTPSNEEALAKGIALGMSMIGGKE